MTGIWPDYDAYQAKTERMIPLVTLEPVTGLRTAAGRRYTRPGPGTWRNGRRGGLKHR